MKVIETNYKGYRFRSRLEARWAVFFDACGIPWLYEPEGFDLGDAGYYLPDFYLPTVMPRGHDKPGLWVEVKGVLDDASKEKINAFCGIEKIYGADHDYAMLCYRIADEKGISFSEAEQTEEAKKLKLLVDKVGEEHNPILLLGQIPEEWCDFCQRDDEFWNFYWIDGDWFHDGIFGRNKNNAWVFLNDYCCTQEDIEVVNKALKKARSARFEHGEGKQ